VKVSGSGASRRAAEQAAAKKALDDVMAAAPAVVAKPKRSKGARAAKAEAEIVPGVTGVQAALDLRAPDHRRAERAARGETKPVGPEVPSAGQAAAAAPLAVIRAAHVEKTADKPETVVRLSERQPSADKQPERTADKALDKPSDKSTDTSTEKAADKPTDKPTDKPDASARTADKPASRSREAAPGGTSAPAVSAPGASADLEPGVAGAVHTRVADAGH
jgi:ribonuclease III